MRDFGGGGFEEFSSGRDVEEEIAYGDGGSQWGSGWFGVGVLFCFCFGIDFESGLLASGSADDSCPADAGDAGEGLSTKSHGTDGEEVFGGGEFAGGMWCPGQGDIMAIKARAVVGYLDEAFAAVLDSDVDACGLGVDGVFEKLLDHRGWPFDNLSGGYLVDQQCGEYFDLSHGVALWSVP